MARPPQNSITKLRQSPSDQLLSRRQNLLLGFRVLLVAATILGVGGLVAALTDRGNPSVFLGVATLQVVGAVYAKMKLWIIDLVLSERGTRQ